VLNYREQTINLPWKASAPFAIKEVKMKKLIAAVGFAALVFAEYASVSAVTMESAEAAVCARGMRGAACVGPHGAVGVRRVHPRVVVHPRRVYRRW
jgi:hypothetical protein